METNPVKKFFTPSKIDEKNERSLSNGKPSSETALSTLFGSLRLYDDDLVNNPASTKYKTTAAPYDIVIRINSLFELRSQGWEILLGEHTKNFLPNKMITESSVSTKTPSEQRQGVVVTVLGAYNRGKSFLLRKLCKIKLPNGNLIHTEGISITAGRENYTNIVFLDTAGTDTPVKNDEIEYKRATEALLREVLLHLSTCILIVVNRLRATDQIYIKQILKYCRNHENKKNIIIVHNLLDIETIEDVNEIINKEIKITFGAIEETIQLVANGTSRSINYFTSKQQGVDVRHYVLAKTHSHAADIWNRQSLDGIMNFFQNVDNKRSLDIINDMIVFINNKLPELFKNYNNSRSITTHQNLQIVQHENQPYIVISDRKYRQNLQEEPYPLELSEKLVYDDAGYFIRNESGHWQPRYNLYEDDTNYCLIVELSGFKKGELTTDVLEKSVTIEGTRSDLNTSMTDPIIRQSDIPIGSFKLHIPFKFEIASTEIIAEREDGFIRLTIPKKRQDQISIDI